MIALLDEQRKIVAQILESNIPTAHIYIFGSRAVGNPKPHSDLDLAIDMGSPLSLQQMAQLKDAFSESDLPFRVDVVDMQAVSPEFLKIIQKTAKNF